MWQLSPVGFFKALYSQCLCRLEQQDADTVEDERAADEHSKEQRQVCSKGLCVNAGNSQVCKANVVKHLRCIGVQNDKDEQHHCKRDHKTHQAADNRGKCSDCQQSKDSKNQTDKAAELNSDKAILDVALEGEKHNVADVDQPAIIEIDDVHESVDDKDPDKQHDAEVEQKTFCYSFVHDKTSP